jgi:hypothetical protein
MTRTWILLLAAALAAGAANAETEVRTIEKHYEIGSGHEVLLDLPVGEVIVEAGRGREVDVEIVISCRSRSERCREQAEEVYLDESEREHTLALDVRGLSGRVTSRPSVDVRLRMPEEAAFELDMGVGEVRVTGLRADVEIDVGVGEVTVAVPEKAVGSLRLAVGVGDVELEPERDDQSDSGFLFLGNEISWDQGPGKAHLAVDVGVGDVTVRLE